MRRILCALLVFGCLIAPVAHAQSLDQPIATAPAESPLPAPPLAYAEPETIGSALPPGTPWLTTPPEQDRCSGMLAVGIGQGRVLEYYGIDVADGNAVTHGSASYGCTVTRNDRIFVGGGVITPLAGTRDNLGHEEEFSGGYDHLMRLPVGRVTGGVFAVYRSINRFGVMKDDYLRVGAHAGYSVRLGPLTFSPDLAYVRDEPMLDNNQLNFWRTRLSFAFSRQNGGSCSFEPEFVHDVNSLTAVIHKNVWYGSLGCTSLLPHRFSVYTGLSFAQYREHDSGLSLYTERDGRIWYVPRAGGPHGAGPVVGLMVELRRAL